MAWFYRNDSWVTELEYNNNNLYSVYSEVLDFNISRLNLLIHYLKTIAVVVNNTNRQTSK